MTYSRLPGVYFSESVSTITVDTEKIPLFIVQTSSTIVSIDEQLTLFENLDTFKSVVDGKGLANTTSFIEDTLTEAGILNASFYVYSVKTDTAANFTKILVDSSNKDEMKEVFFFEETKSANANTLTAKIGALRSGADECAENGADRIIYIIPYGTVTDAVANQEANSRTETTVINTLTTTLTGISSGRVSVIIPDYGGAIAGRVVDSEYNEEVGFKEIKTGITGLTYNFTRNEMVTLMNMGVMFIRPEKVRGASVYRVNLGVSTDFASDKSDGLLICRRVTDEVLRQVKYECDKFIKAGEDTQNGVLALQTDIDNVLDRFITAGEVYEDETNLVVNAGADTYSYEIGGKIKPMRATIAINVDTTLV